ncbi:protein NRT1/ PTR FAMILY 5.10 isoform X2 [Ziziphus jujuba]|uniref:Protein NRT1/ PTR FAMILY 5.10 isoform X2 n=1 Tax=Ziziphus jujuba TaxID=326968 RepID=A0ABM3IN84_ZIZJJ|nr:protein NRT1/ PTR FAMILY 5.10 isoform X2 [Ziziphus jujuba]
MERRNQTLPFPMSNNISSLSGSDAETPLLNDTVDDAVDYKGRSVLRSKSGGWRSAVFIIGVEIAERFAYYGISSNLISFLTGPMGQSTATAAENVNAWDGTASLLPLLGAFLADTFLGRYRTIVVASLLYVLSFYIPNQQSSFAANWIVSYIQDNLNWGLGFGVPCIAMAVALVVFLFGTPTYRHRIIVQDKDSPFVRIGRVFILAIRNWKAKPLVLTTEAEYCGVHESSEQFKFLNKALAVRNGLKEEVKVYCSMEEVEEAKAVLRLVPIWGTCLIYGIVLGQCSTFFVKQAATMKRTVMAGFDIPAASIQSFDSLAIVLFIPIYDGILVPMARSYTGKPSGITTLQRIGTGIVLSVLSMALAAVVETKRLKTAQEYGLVDKPNMTVPMSVWWLAPAYLLLGVADVFTMVGLQEFFYDQVPNELRSIGLALYLSIFGVGSFLSGFLISAIDEVTGGDGHDSWFSSNLNRAHIDYFYWLLAVLSALGFAAYLYFARSYIYKL